MGGYIKTTKKQIIEWGMNNIYEGDFPVDNADMDTRCWRCGYKRDTERCHVIPHSLGGEDTPSNYRLLCPECHVEGPNVNDPDAMDKWIRSTGVGTYDTFWKIREISDSVWKDSTYHAGEKLNTSTKEWMAEKFLERLKDNGINPNWLGAEKIKACLKT